MSWELQWFVEVSASGVMELQWFMEVAASGVMGIAVVWWRLQVVVSWVVGDCSGGAELQ